MAGLSTKAIKSRMKSMQSTRQITKAMELVATSKLRSAQQRALAVRPYFQSIYQAMNDIAESSKSFASPYLQAPASGTCLYIVIAGDRGLAGGYNNNLFKLAMSDMPSDCCVLPIGKKSVEYFKNKGFQLFSESYPEAADVSLDDCYTIAKMISEGFLLGKLSEIHLYYTNFTSMLCQTPAGLKLLPLQMHVGKQAVTSDMIYESGEEGVFNAIVPEYLGGVIYGAMCESTASEQAARRTAMDSASKNADEIISDLNLSYNRARQSAITQEITEIVAGAEQS